MRLLRSSAHDGRSRSADRCLQFEALVRGARCHVFVLSLDGVRIRRSLPVPAGLTLSEVPAG